MELVADNLTEISAHVRTLGWIGANESITDLSRAGDGNMNRTLRASVGSRSIILKQSVPYVAKYPAIPAPADRIEVEACFYDAIAADEHLALRVPQVIGFDPNNRLLCLEDLGAAQDFTDMYQGSAPCNGQRAGHLATLIDWLGKLHALPIATDSLADRLFNRPMRELNHEHIFEIPLNPNNGLTLSAGLQATAADFAADVELKDRASALGTVYLGKADHQSPDVLLHGDFYPGSWLQHATRGAMVIDPEFAFLGPPEFDLGVLVAHLTMCGYRSSDLMQWRNRYRPPADFDDRLVQGFAGMEIIRRLLGVAQLPLSASDAIRLDWLALARTMVLEPANLQASGP